MVRRARGNSARAAQSRGFQGGGFNRGGGGNEFSCGRFN
jgi:hypothetical protein